MFQMSPLGGSEANKLWLLKRHFLQDSHCYILYIQGAEAMDAIVLLGLSLLQTSREQRRSTQLCYWDSHYYRHPGSRGERRNCVTGTLITTDIQGAEAIDAIWTLVDYGSVQSTAKLSWTIALNYNHLLEYSHFCMSLTDTIILYLCVDNMFNINL